MGASFLSNLDPCRRRWARVVRTRAEACQGRFLNRRGAIVTLDTRRARAQAVTVGGEFSEVKNTTARVFINAGDFCCVLSS